MKRLLFLAVAFVAVGTSLVASSAVPGVVVSPEETTRLMGSDQCWQNGPLAYVCYRDTCMSGGCGCTKVYSLIPGTHSRQSAAPHVCRDGGSCTISEDIDIGGSCGGAGGGGE